MTKGTKIKHTNKTVLMTVLLISNVAFAQVPPTYRVIAQKYGIDPAMMYAIAHAESGKKNKTGLFMPWPWTANICDMSPGVRCKGYFFESREEMYQKLKNELARGNDWFDVGQVQMNWHVHQKRFGNDLWLATHPLVNLNQSAGLIRELTRSQKSMIDVFAAYHAGPAWRSRQVSENRKNQIIGYANTTYKHYVRIYQNEQINRQSNTQTQSSSDLN